MGNLENGGSPFLIDETPASQRDLEQAVQLSQTFQAIAKVAAKEKDPVLKKQLEKAISEGEKSIKVLMGRISP